MNKYFKTKSILGLFLIAIMAFSCSSDDNTDITIPPPGDDDPVATFDAELFVSESGGDMRNVTATVNADTGTEITSKVSFLTVTENMRRLYIVKQLSGEAPVPFQFENQDVDEKADGSLDLVGDNANGFDFQIDLPAPTMAEGTIIYTFWATTGPGDFRDTTKRNAMPDEAIGTITVTYDGTTMGTDSRIVEYPIKLEAPLGDGNSETFMSLYNGQLYRISEGEETAALWDFGYFYLNATGPTLSSTSDYHPIFNYDPVTMTFENISQLTGVPQGELNKFYFAPSSIDFDTATVADLQGIITPTSERATELSAGSVLEFEDAYGNKGMIRVDEVSGTFNSGDFIRITIKALQ